MIDRKPEITVPYPAAGTSGKIEIHLDKEVFLHDDGGKRWERMRSMFIQESVYSALKKEVVYPKFSYTDEHGVYKSPVFEVNGQMLDDKWLAFAREVDREVAELLYNKADMKNPNQDPPLPRF